MPDPSLLLWLANPLPDPKSAGVPGRPLAITYLNDRLYERPFTIYRKNDVSGQASPKS